MRNSQAITIESKLNPADLEANPIILCLRKTLAARQRQIGALRLDAQPIMVAKDFSSVAFQIEVVPGNLKA